MINQDKLLNIKVVAGILGISPSTIRRLEKRGRFPQRTRIPGSKRIGWTLSNLNKYLAEISRTQVAPLSYNRTWRS